MTRIRSAIYVDFDNVFGGLMALGETAGLAFAKDPGEWLERLATEGLNPGERREFLVRRCYMNPSGYVRSEEFGDDRGRAYFSRFRPFFTRCGFEVIDCPSLTQASKNAADIRIVIDVLDGLEAPVVYDEFVLASSDADFTPLLQRVRSLDRRATLLAGGETAQALRGVVSRYFDVASVCALVLGELLEREDGDSGAAPREEPETPADAGASKTGAAEDWREEIAAAVACVRSSVASAALGKPIATIGNELRDAFGDDIRRSDWFGYGSLSTFLLAEVCGPEVRMDAGSIRSSAQREVGSPVVPAIVDRLARVTDLPRLDRQTWQAVFNVLAEYAQTHTFNLTESSSFGRDRLRESGFSVGRQAVGFVVRGALFGGCPLNTVPPPDAQRIGEAFYRSQLQQARASRYELGVARCSRLRGERRRFERLHPGRSIGEGNSRPPRLVEGDGGPMAAVLPGLPICNVRRADTD